MKTILSIFLAHIIIYHIHSQNYDYYILKNINTNRNKNLNPSIKFITNTRSYISSTLFSGLCIYSIIKKDSAAWFKTKILAGSVMINTLFTLSLKYSINRKRPYEKYNDIEKLSSGGSPSFPSGHSSEAFATATFIALEFKKWYYVVPAYTWASAISYTRVPLGVHYPSDVAAGAFIRASSAFVSRWINKKLFQTKPQCLKY